jgi:S1-C subfamily serine protease
MWRLGPAGTEIPLVIVRDGTRLELKVRSADRGDFLKKPRLQ